MNAAAQEPAISLRPMREADLPAVAAVEQRAYPFPWSPGIFRDCLRAGYACWVAEDARGLAGYAVLSVAAGEAHLLNLCVAPEHQSRGLGARLLARIIAAARGADAQRVFLEVRPSNAPAIALYDRAGFNEIGRRRGYYPAVGGREDALVLALELLPED
ncbi:ribosomal protein S18-alanine N-acetyltransferase [Coralloluteibacterium thermophilus]|uniref:[Ribosomal protein bS18]-alanine N-acetyltransferase n=1 Tax=Coralloluteibacterium thermophilum TaxID=2707049 RepID=A0ABV9NH71_9GAMM